MAKAAVGINPEGRAKRVTWNTLFLSGSEVLSRFFTWLTITYLTRHWLDVASYGQYATVINLAAIFSAFGDLGLSGFTVREVAQKKERTEFFLRNVMALKMIFAALYYSVFQIAAWALHYEPIMRWAILIMGLRLVLDAIANPFALLLQAHELMAYQSLISMVSSFLRMSGIILAVRQGAGIVGVCWVWVGISAVSLLISWAVGSWREWNVQWKKIRLGEAWGIFVQAIPFAAFGTFQMIYNRVDAVILKSFSGNEAVAYYDVACRFLFLVFMFSQVFAAASFPTLSFVQDADLEFKRLALRAVKVMVILGLPIAVGGCLLALPLMVFLFGANYAQAGSAFKVIVPSVLFFFVARVTVNILAIQNTVQLIRIYASLAVVNIVTNFILIPRFGFMGASWASLGCAVLESVLCLWSARVYLGGALAFSFWRCLGAALLATSFMGLGIHFDPRLYWLALGPLVYGTGLYLLGGLEAEDIASLKSVLGMKNPV